MSEADATAHWEELARRAAEGDELAFGRLARELRPRLYRWAVVQAGDPDDAEDITQAALLRMHRGLARFQFGSRLSTWLFAILRNAAADWRRAERRRTVRQRWYATSHPESAAPEVQTGDARLLAVIREAFRGLPGRQREIFDLVELQGRAAPEVAELLALSDSTVRVHLLRARRTIRERVLARSALEARPPEGREARS